MRQTDLDREMIQMGRDRYWSKVSRGQQNEMETYSPVAKRLLGESIIKLQESIDLWCHNARTGPGRRHRARGSAGPAQCGASGGEGHPRAADPERGCAPRGAEQSPTKGKWKKGKKQSVNN